MSTPRTAGLVLLLVAFFAACGDDGERDQSATSEDAGGRESSTVEARPAEPCTLLTEADFEASLDASVDEPEDVSGAFGFAITPDLEPESHACQWRATATSDEALISGFSVELVTVVGDDAAAAYEAEIEVTGRFLDVPPEPIELEGADEAVGYLEDQSPEIVARTDDVAFILSTASDEMTVEDLAPLAERVLANLG